MKDQPKNKGYGRNQPLREDDGKRTPPAHTGYETDGKQHDTRPEQEPDIPPQERTEGIP